MKKTSKYSSKTIAIGLLGGSFNPPHEGHRHISKVAIKVFGLSKIYWLYTRQNPLKRMKPKSLKARLEKSQSLVKHPKIKFSNIEQRKDFTYTVEVLKYLKKNNPTANFIWIMGEDNLLSFHLWKDWEWIVKNYKIGVMARGNRRAAVNSSKFCLKFKHCRLHTGKSKKLISMRAPSWCIVSNKKANISSSDIRSNV